MGLAMRLRESQEWLERWSWYLELEQRPVEPELEYLGGRIVIDMTVAIHVRRLGRFLAVHSIVFRLLKEVRALQALPQLRLKIITWMWVSSGPKAFSENSLLSLVQGGAL